MSRGIPHPPELRAQVIAAIVAGQTIAEVARRFKLNKGLVSRWASASGTVATTRALQRSPEALEAMIFDLVAEHIQTLRAQLQAAASAAYVQGQTAGELATLLGTERDTLIRLLAGFRPVEPALPAPDAGADPGAA